VGEFQTGNAAAVLMLLEVAGLSDAVDTQLVNTVLPKVSLKGRLQRLRLDIPGSQGKEWLIDVAHNPAAAQVLAKTLDATQIDGGIIAIVGLLDDKDVEGVVGALADQVDHWIAVTADSPRAIDAGELARQVANKTNASCLEAGSLDAAVSRAQELAHPDDRVLVTGSFYLVGPVLERLERRSNE
jgi:dihydrofolate synthase/folylpolyglutamate synthase